MELWGQRCVTTSDVMAEYKAGVLAKGFSSEYWQTIDIVALSPPEQVWMQNNTTLGIGERSCLAIAIHRPSLFVTDDAYARRIAKKHNVPVSGTLGILIVNVQKARLHLDEANQLLIQLIDFGYRSPWSKLDDLIGL